MELEPITKGVVEAASLRRPYIAGEVYAERVLHYCSWLDDIMSADSESAEWDTGVLRHTDTYRWS